MELFNFQTKQLETVPEEEFGAAITSGMYGPRKGVSIPVVTEDGRKGNIPSEKAFQAFQSGRVRLYTQAEQEEDARRAQAGTFTGILAGSAASLARGATLGLSDVALTAGDSPGALERKAYLNTFRDVHPGTSLSLDVIGAIVPSLLTGGTGIAARGGAKATKALAAKKALSYTPAALAVQAGRAAEGAVARTIAGQTAASQAALTMGQRIAPRAVGSAVEGAAFATGQLVGESALGNAELTGESLAATVGFGALLGGGLGGTLALPGALSSRAFTASKSQFEKSVASVRQSAEEFAEEAQKRGGASAAEAKKILENISEDILDGANVPLPSSKYFDPSDISPFTRIEKAVAATGQLTREEARRFLKHTDRIKQAPDAPDFLNIFEDALTRSDTGVEDVIRKLGNALDDRIARSGEEMNIGDLAVKVGEIRSRIGTSGVTDKSRNKAVRFLSQFEKDIRAKHKILNKNVPLSAVREEIKSLRARLPARETVGEAAGEELERVVMELDQFLSAQIKQNPNIGTETSSILDEMSKLITTRNAARKILKTQDPARLMRTLAQDFDGSIQPRFDRLGTPNQLQVLVDIAPFAQFKGQPVNFRELFKDRILREKLVASGALQETAAAQAQKQFFRMIAGSAVGADLIAAGSRAGFVAESIKFGRGKLFEKLTQPGDNLFKSVFNKMKGLEGVKQRVERSIREGATNFKAAARGGSAVPGVRITGPVVPAATTIFTSFALNNEKLGGRSKDPNEAAMQVSNEILELTSNPEKLSANVSKQLDNLYEVAPQSANAAAMTAFRAAAFLNRVAPRSPFEGQMYPPPYTPSDSEVQQFANFLQAIEDPMQIFKDFELGVISQDQVTVLREVYPEMYGFFVETLLEELSGDFQPDDQQRLAMSMVLGIPVSPLLDGKFIMRMQMMNEPETAAQGQGPDRLSVQGLNKLSRSEAKKSPLEKAQMGEIGD